MIFSSIKLSVLLLLFSSVLHFSYAEEIRVNDNSPLIISDVHLWREMPKHFSKKDIESLRKLYETQPSLDSISQKSGTFFTKIEINTSDRKEWFIVPNANFVDLGLGIYWSDFQSQTIQKSFSQLNDSSAPHLLHFQTLEVESEVKKEIWLIISAKKFSNPVSLAIYTKAQFYQFQMFNNSLTIISITVMVLLSMLSLLTYFGTFQRVAITCAGYLGFHGLGWAAASGLLDDIFDLPANSTYWGIYIFPFALAFAGQFASDLFETRSNHLKLNKFLSGLSLVYLMNGFLMWVLPFSSSFIISHLLATSWVLVSTVIGIKMLNLKDFRAKYFLFGNLLYGSSLVYFVMAHSNIFGELPYPELTVVSALSIDCVCIILSLSEWFRIKRTEFKENYYLSRRDSMTNLGNRYALTEEISELKGDFIISYMDLDGLKSVNDTLGHASGDELIVKAGKYLSDSFENLGKVFRVGGDEFVIIIKVSSSKHIASIVEKANSLSLEVSSKLTKVWQQAGLSYGICTSIEQDSPSRCLSLADKKMYLMKHHS